MTQRPATSNAEPSPRRKACDACHARKRKCNRQRPTCSACILHGSACAWTMRPAPPSGLPRAAGNRVATANVETRMAHVETQLAALHDKMGDVQQSLQQALQQAVVRQKWAGPWMSAGNTRSTQVFTALRLSRHMLVAVAEQYFALLNPLLPLFDRDDFFVTLHACCDRQSLRRREDEEQASEDDADDADDDDADSDDDDTVLSWAAVHVVVALALQGHAACVELAPDTRAAMVRQCVARIERVLGRLLLRQPPSLRAAQVLLGCVMLMPWSASSVRHPAAPLVAAAAAMARALAPRHGARVGTHFGDREATPHCAAFRRLLLVALVLDRDVNLRAGLPYVLREFPATVDGEADLVAGLDGTVSDAFRTRLGLARLEARVGDWNRLRCDETPGPADDLDQCLLAWRQSLPPAAALAPPALVRQRCELLATYYCCRFWVHGVFLHDDRWMERLSQYSRQQLTKPSPGEQREQISPSPSPASWGPLVVDARTCMDLVGRPDTANDAVLEANTRCAYISSFLILVAQRARAAAVTDFGDDHGDDARIEQGLVYLQHTHEQTGDDRFRSLAQACVQLLA
ncbi:hypothetical protein SCUCBS95973_000105 [Sporothrix curviconia]|uniref:Zn(2)-C6 fungal-type domain-containing protein n=1 Tax=Sporothrix curviconia TaxID=1260050 RepID=A0ABP0AM81_9PEZI